MLVLVSAAWRRYDVTQLALAQRSWLTAELAGQGIEATSVIVADDENLDIAQQFGFRTIEQNNEYLGRKFNDGIEYALRELEAEYIVLIGSDDWVHTSLFSVLPRALAPTELPTLERPVVVGKAQPEVISGAEIAVADLLTGRLSTCRVRGRLGVVPWILHRKALEPSGGRPIREDQQRGIDGALYRGLKCRPQFVFHDPHPLCRVDFKSELNLNSYDQLSAGIGYGRELSVDALSELYPQDLVDRAVSCVSLRVRGAA